MSVVKVWPLVPGLLGADARGNVVELTLGRPGWMDEKAATRLAVTGSLQIMAGIRPQDLKRPNLVTSEIEADETLPELPEEPPTKPQTYNRRDMRARR